ncbi:MAG: hypothetical protein MPJ50_06220 [Pirellulales bacterium]|nr:hypothetical protein [Pirellulales bacterium]
MSSDQAFALRELVKRNSGDSSGCEGDFVVVVGGLPGVGSTTVARAIAATQADQGHQTLFVDVAGNAGATAALGANASLALPDVVEDLSLAAAAIQAGPGKAFFLPNHPLPEGLPAEQLQEIAKSVPDVLGQLSAGFESVIVDRGNSHTGGWRKLWNDAKSVVVVTNATDESVMGAYAAIKGNVPTSCPDIRVLVNAVDSRGSAEQVWGKIAAAAKRFLGLTLRFAGYLPLAVEGASNEGVSPVLENDATARLCLRRIVSDLDDSERAVGASIARSAELAQSKKSTE